MAERFVIDATAFAEFEAMLDRPAKRNERLAKLLSAPTVFDAITNAVTLETSADALRDRCLWIDSCAPPDLRILLSVEQARSLGIV